MKIVHACSLKILNKKEIEELFNNLKVYEYECI